MFFDILDPKDGELLYHWLDANLLTWVHLAPVCGTFSRARQIPNGGQGRFAAMNARWGLPAPQQQRVDVANEMYVESCKIFLHCVSKGILVTVENPSNSL